MREIEGVYVANVTPFKDDGSLDVDIGAYLEHVSWLAEMGVRGIVPLGTNGEGPSVALGEKVRVLEALFGRGCPIQVIPAVMQSNLPETLEMLRVLEDYPATAVLVLPPYYFKPVEPEGMVRFYEPVLAATGHTAIVYHIPKYAVPVPDRIVRGGRLRRGRSRRRQGRAPRYGGRPLAEARYGGSGCYLRPCQLHPRRGARTVRKARGWRRGRRHGPLREAPEGTEAYQGVRLSGGPQETCAGTARGADGDRTPSLRARPRELRSHPRAARVEDRRRTLAVPTPDVRAIHFVLHRCAGRW